jgi:hypothetical protein
MVVVATVISLVVQTTNIVLNLDDGTGRIEARHWVDSTAQDEMGKWGDIEYVNLHSRYMQYLTKVSRSLQREQIRPRHWHHQKLQQQTLH